MTGYELKGCLKALDLLRSTSAVERTPVVVQTSIEEAIVKLEQVVARRRVCTECGGRGRTADDYALLGSSDCKFCNDGVRR